ncbi:MAG: hypothetical protein GTO42_09735 [Candidatus Latescibacteria bacterium]|nr:hypothetical protein [Candidatus Latescibacterota bacterium]
MSDGEVRRPLVTAWADHADIDERMSEACQPGLNCLSTVWKSDGGRSK